MRLHFKRMCGALRIIINNCFKNIIKLRENFARIGCVVLISFLIYIILIITVLREHEKRENANHFSNSRYRANSRNVTYERSVLLAPRGS